jgi:hypothetical protein
VSAHDHVVLAVVRDVDVEGVHRVAGGMVLADAQRLEVVVVGLDLGPFHDGEAHRDERRQHIA